MEHVLNCPVCGTVVDYYDICEKCGYQNSGPKEKMDGPAGPNKMTLREAKEAYKKGEKIV